MVQGSTAVPAGGERLDLPYESPYAGGEMRFQRRRISMRAPSSAIPGLAEDVAAQFNPALAPDPPPSTPIPDTDPDATAYVRSILTKVARGELERSDFAFVRQTAFPRIREALTETLRDLGAPDRMELLQQRRVGDDTQLEYYAWFGPRRFRVAVSLAPEGGLTALRVASEG